VNEAATSFISLSKVVISRVMGEFAIDRGVQRYCQKQYRANCSQSASVWQKLVCPLCLSVESFGVSRRDDQIPGFKRHYWTGMTH